MKKIRVLHLLATNKFSGAENVVCTIIKNMSNDYEMAYCSPMGSIKEKLEEEDIYYLPLQKLSFGEIRKAIKIFKPDIIHAHDNKATVLSSFFSKQCIVISHIHGNNSIMNKKNLKTLLFNICSKKIRNFIWVSDSSLHDYYFKKQVIHKSIVLYNVIDKNKIYNLSNLYDINENYDLIYLGRLGFPKNPKRFIEIVKIIKEKNKNIKVAIVGDGDDKEIIDSKIAEYALQDNVKMYGFQSNPYPILKKSKILVMTSLYEGTPMCALEAQSFGIPIVATPVDGLKKIVKNNNNGFLSNNDNEIVNIIIELLHNKKEYIRYSKSSLKMFDEINNLNAYCEIISSIYKGD